MSLPLSREEITEQAGGPKSGSKDPASCAIESLEATVICDTDKTDLFISQGTTEKPWGGEEGNKAGATATHSQGPAST